MVKRRLCGNWYVNVVEHSPTIRNKFDIEYINVKTRQIFSSSYHTIKEINKLNRKAKQFLCKVKKGRR